MKRLQKQGLKSKNISDFLKILPQKIYIRIKHININIYIPLLQRTQNSNIKENTNKMKDTIMNRQATD